MKALERRLTLTAVTAISISAMVGSGIFVLPGLASAMTGPSVWLAYLTAGLCALPAVLSKAELATAMPTSGGTYVYLERSLGPLGGTVAGMGLWLSMLLKSAFALVGFGAYLVVVSDLPLRPTALTLLAVIAVLNVVGVRKVAQAQLAVVAIALVCLSGLVVAGLWQVEPDRLRDEFPEGLDGFLAATGFVFVSYAGVTKVAAVAEEVKNPSRNLPLGMLLSLFIAMGVYGAVVFVLVGNVPLDALAYDVKPIHTLTVELGGPALGIGAAILGIVTMTSMANSGLLAASRFPFAMSRDALLPPSFQAVSERFSTPVTSILVTAGTIAFAIVFLDVEKMAKLASAVVILLYVSVNAAVVVFREAGTQWYDPPFKTPFYPWTQALGIVAGLALLGTLGAMPLLAIAAIFVLGLLLYFPYGRPRARRLGVLRKMARRTDLLRDEAHAIEEEIVGDAAVVVPLFGEERSPEALVEVGAALAGGRRVEVVHLTEVPEQTLLEAVIEEDAAVRSLRRRVGAMAEEKAVDADFHAAVSRDLVRTVHHVTSQVHCEWLVMQWRGSRRRRLMPYNPLGWLINHLSANLALFHDAGVRYVREILVLAEPGPDDALVVRTADRLALQYGAKLTFIRFVHRRAPEEKVDNALAYVGQLRALCESESRTQIVRGYDEVAAIVKATSSADLMVTGAPDFTFFGLLRRRGFDRFVGRAACSVLTLKTPRQQTHQAFDRTTAEGTTDGFSLLEYVDPDCVAAKLDAQRKDPLFFRFARDFEPVTGVDHRRIQTALWERERTQNTSVGDGVAMPHAPLDIQRSSLGIYTTERPIDYQGPDQRGVDVFFVAIGPERDRRTHLMILSTIAKLAMETSLLAELREAESRDDVLEALGRAEQALRRERSDATNPHLVM